MFCSLWIRPCTAVCEFWKCRVHVCQCQSPTVMSLLSPKNSVYCVWNLAWQSDCALQHVETFLLDLGFDLQGEEGLANKSHWHTFPQERCSFLYYLLDIHEKQNCIRIKVSVTAARWDTINVTFRRMFGLIK